MFLWIFLLASVIAQGQWFAGGSVGIATLTGDGNTVVNASRTSIALYKPQNGFAFQLLAGRHIREYFSVQANYGWNRNSVSFTGLNLVGGQEDSFEQQRTLSQNSGGVDGMIYFQPRTARFRPYVSGGAGLIRLDSVAQNLLIRKGNPSLPADRFSATKPYWRTAVGLDVQLFPKWRFRYTFWETVTSNPLSSQLRPQGKALFLNFLNQFGFVREF